MLSDRIKQKARELDYVSCGIIPSAAFYEFEKYLNERAETYPESKHFYAPFREFTNPPGEGKSLIVCVRSQTRYKIPESLRGRIGRNYLFDDRIPYSPDYRRRAEFENWMSVNGLNIIKYTPPSRWAAAKAGVAKFGRNNFSYDEAHGSYIKIQAWLVDRKLDYDEPSGDIYLSGCGEGCEKCVKACPTGALSRGFSMDMAVCVTRLSTYAEEGPDENVRRQMSCWIYGCDACQDACPYNKNEIVANEEYPLLREYEEILRLENIAEMDERTYSRVILPRFGYAGKDGLWHWQYNALRAMINSGDEKYRTIIEKFRGHPDARIRGICL